MSYAYSGILSQQVPDGPSVVMFSAPAVDIERWAGIPQRRRIQASGASVETAGFQRESRPARISEIASFMRNPKNVIQNPLLTAVQDTASVEIRDAGGGCCEVLINEPSVDSLTLLELLEGASAHLVTRIPGLSERAVSADLTRSLREDLAEHYRDSSSEEQSEDESESEDASQAEDSNGGELEVVSALFQEETQVVDFYDELNARVAVLRELGDVADGFDSVGGFTRDYLISLLLPVVLVDGQHRLLGALAAVDLEQQSEEGMAKQAEYVSAGLSPEQAADKFRAEVSRGLPISLLVTSSPAEHVFQFVVVNQKATPMSPALLGTIVSTSLSQDELDTIARRLSDAGIKLESSRAVAFLSRSSDSPFYQLVSTGISGDKPNALPWSVLLRIANMVRELEGGKSYHPPHVDYVKTWAKNYFSETGLVPEGLSDEERRTEWRKNDGPWRQLFVKLHCKIRDTFGDADDVDANNGWGSTKSNLFNMVSLTILTQDYFSFLREGTWTLANWQEVDESLDAWLEGLNRGYFNRNWRMGGTKKDQPAIKEAWSAAWFGYRLEKDRMPRVEVYNPGGSR